MRDVLVSIGIGVVVAAGFALPATAGDSGARVEYIGGTRPDISTGQRGHLQATDEHYLVFYAKQGSLRVPYQQVNLLEYGQKVDRRYAMAVLVSPVLILSKKRQHFLTVGYVDDQGREQALIFKVEKDDIRVALVSLEARTGRKVQFQDDDARKAGRG
jgi:hypothetical protein